ncbi:extensin-like domain-containing protein [Roseibium marinum]|uniref:extensin-like domain-containing protein n=1 Tax=Roseibium marinum TaxID=281252 RepID=UPI001476607A|nr:extensin family protein [Roseibium marinum]
MAEPVTDGGYEDCGIADPVRLAGVVSGPNTAKFHAPVTISCDFAKVLTDWLRRDVLPVAELEFGIPVAVVASGPGYQCRRRNNRPDGKLSEHALGMAIDITQFQLADSSNISIEKDWVTATGKGKFLQAIHAKACRRFTTVLGPDADANHRSHFHLDAGCHGQDCTYIICQ